MANRFFQQFSFGLDHYPVRLDCNALIGASGATSALKGSGVLSLTRLAAGVYKAVLEDDYFRFLNFSAIFRAPVTGAAVTAGSFVTGTAYEIVTVGSTDYSAVGLPTGVTAAPGVAFVATGAGSGSGTVKALGSSGVFAVSLLGDPQTMDSSTVQGSGATIFFKCLDATGAAVDPASGSQIFLQFWMRNSSVKGKGE